MLAAVAHDVIRFNEYRCSCGKLLFRGYLLAGAHIEVKCRGCDRVVIVQVERDTLT